MFGKQVGEAGPILDVMSGMLENISTITVIARTTISAVYRTAQIVASLPNLSYQNKARSTIGVIFDFFSSAILSLLLNTVLVNKFSFGIGFS